MRTPRSGGRRPNQWNGCEDEEDSCEPIWVEPELRRQEVGQCGGRILMVNRIKLERERDDEPDDDRPILEFPIGGFHVHSQTGFWREESYHRNWGM